jgi:glycosyltransferase involved in cell wall biosynthesis
MENNEIAVSVVIPVYNEREAMAHVLDQVIGVMDGMGVTYEIIVVDDGCTDETPDICRGYPGVRVLCHERNRGTGAARTTGVRHALGQKIIMIDADGTYPVDVFPQMIAALDECEMVIGAREREMGTIKWLRSITKNFIRALASYLTRTPIPDLNSGLRAMKRDLVLEFLPILPESHSWVSTITMAFLSTGYRVRWIPIEYYKRIGHSTFHPVRDTYNYLTLVVRAIMYFNPLRVFLPLTLFLFALGTGKLVYDLIVHSFRIPTNTVILILTAFQVGAIGLLADLIVKRGALRK